MRPGSPQPPCGSHGEGNSLVCFPASRGRWSFHGLLWGGVGELSPAQSQPQESGLTVDLGGLLPPQGMPMSPSQLRGWGCGRRKVGLLFPKAKLLWVHPLVPDSPSLRLGEQQED